MSVTFLELRNMLAARQAMPMPSTLCVDVLKKDESEALTHLARWQKTNLPHLDRPRMALFVQTEPSLEAMLQALLGGQHAVTRLMRLCNGDVRVYEMGDANTTPLSEAVAAHAISYGLLALEEATDVLLLGLLGEGNAPLFQDLEKNLDRADNVFPLFAATGRADLCALLGAAMAARMACIPVITDASLAPMLRRALGLLCDNEDSPIYPALAATQTYDPVLQAAFSVHTLQALTTLSAVA